MTALMCPSGWGNGVGGNAGGGPGKGKGFGYGSSSSDSSSEEDEQDERPVEIKPSVRWAEKEGRIYGFVSAPFVFPIHILVRRMQEGKWPQIGEEIPPERQDCSDPRATETDKNRQAEGTSTQKGLECRLRGSCYAYD